MIKPIERIRSTSKATVKREVARRSRELLDRTTVYPNLSAYRLNMLESIITESLGSVNQEICISVINYVSVFYADLLELKPVEF